MHRRNLLILNGEMSEWLKEHAWKAKWATLTKSLQNTSQRIRFNDLLLRIAPRCKAVNVGISRKVRPDVTQFLHNSRFHLRVYS